MKRVNLLGPTLFAVTAAFGCGGPLYDLSVKDGDKVVEVENGGIPFYTVEHYEVVAHMLRQDIHKFVVTTRSGGVPNTDGSFPTSYPRVQEAIYYTEDRVCADGLLKAFDSDNSPMGTEARKAFAKAMESDLCKSKLFMTPPLALNYATVTDCAEKKGKCSYYAGSATEQRTRVGTKERYLNVDRPRAGTAEANFTLNDKGLLTKAEANSEDKTIETIGNIATSVLELASAQLPIKELLTSKWDVDDSPSMLPGGPSPTVTLVTLDYSYTPRLHVIECGNDACDKPLAFRVIDASTKTGESPKKPDPKNQVQVSGTITLPKDKGQ